MAERHYSVELYHHGIKGQKWGVRRFQNKDGTRTAAGKQRYSDKYIKTIKGSKVDMMQTKMSSFAKLLAKVNPNAIEKQMRYRHYDLRDKKGNKVGTLDTDISEDGKGLYINWIGINEKHRGNGYAQEVLKNTINLAKQEGFEEMTLEVPTNSPDARHIYEKYGFVDRGTPMLGSYGDIWGGLTEMRLDLKNKR